MQCLLLWLKSQSAIQFLWATTRLKVTRISLIYVVDEFLFSSWCSWTIQGGWVNLRLYLFVSGVNQVEWESEVSPRFPFFTPSVWEFPLRPTPSEVVVEHGVVVITVGSQSRRGAGGGGGVRHKILRPSWGLRHWQFEFNYR